MMVVALVLKAVAVGDWGAAGHHQGSTRVKETAGTHRAGRRQCQCQCQVGSVTHGNASLVRSSATSALIMVSSRLHVCDAKEGCLLLSGLSQAS